MDLRKFYNKATFFPYVATFSSNFLSLNFISVVERMRRLLCHRRSKLNFAGSYRKICHIEYPHDPSVARVIMSNGPVNMFDVTMMRALDATIKEVENNDKVQALVLSSVKPVFSAGLDLTSMYGASREELTVFWSTFQELWVTLYGSRLATVAAIAGHAPAGGCILSLSCDARILGSKSLIGLNEAAFGLVAPAWTVQMMMDVMGIRQGEKACSLGTIFDAKDALSLGLVDTVVDTEENGAEAVLDCAHQEALDWARIPGREASKRLIRSPIIDAFRAGEQEEDLAAFLQLVTSAKVQQQLGAYLESLKAKKKKG